MFCFCGRCRNPCGPAVVVCSLKDSSVPLISADDAGRLYEYFRVEMKGVNALTYPEFERIGR